MKHPQNVQNPMSTALLSTVKWLVHVQNTVKYQKIDFICVENIHKYFVEKGQLSPMRISTFIYSKQCVHERDVYYVIWNIMAIQLL